MKYPIVEFVVDSVEEARYICFLAKGISKGLYQKGNFFVIPYQEKENNLAVYFPDLKYSPTFWSKIIKSKACDLGDNYPKECIDEILEKLKPTKVNNLEKLVSSWRKKEKNFFQIIDDMFVGKLQKIKSIKILLTDYGTLGSYFVKGNEFIGTQRTDVSIDDLGRKIIYCLIKFSNQKRAEIGEHEWYNRRAIVKHLIENTKLNSLIGGARYARPRKKESQLIKDSNNYLSRLGFNHKDGIIKTSGWGDIKIDGTNIEKIFSKNEVYIIKTLLKRKGEIVGFDEFEKIPSLYALSKTVENIRKKVLNMGINTNFVVTVRGKGYCFNF